MSTAHPLILQLDIAGNPSKWITFKDAVYYVAKDLVAWTIGDDGYTVHGGKSRLTGTRSFMDLPSIMAIRGEMKSSHIHRVPTLTNRGLFRRDYNICAYCATKLTVDNATRDHVLPRSRGGPDRWENVVTACGGCNKVKDNKTPEEANMKLIYLPYAPIRSEHLILMNRTILVNQMEFLKSKIPQSSRIHNPPIFN